MTTSRIKMIAQTSVLILVVFLQHFYAIMGAVSCIGENGQAVDWFIAYKLPRLEESSHQYVTEGLGYVYMDSTTNHFVQPDKPISSDASAVGQTLRPIYKDGSLGYIMYNDENPSGHEFFDRAHSKGDLAFDHTSGFWLIHSVPKFPPYADDSFYYPRSGQKYGQSFLCVTFNYSAFNDIGLQLLYNGPNIYDHNLPDDLSSGVPNIQDAISGKYIFTEPYFHVTKLTSLDNVHYTSFAKSKYFGADLYSSLVAPFYSTNLLVETWQNGRSKLPSNCSELTVENIEDLKLGNDSFEETEDHSKWTISKAAGSALVCIGDINRMASQFKRGGGTLCVNSKNIWSAFREAVMDFDACSGQPFGKEKPQLRF